jgi:hypothetical protein
MYKRRMKLIVNNAQKNVTMDKTKNNVFDFLKFSDFIGNYFILILIIMNSYFILLKIKYLFKTIYIYIYNIYIY